MKPEERNPADAARSHAVRHLTVHGAWQGKVGDPQRVFEGTVTASDHPALSSGERVTVRYQMDAGRVPGAGEHGHYVLNSDAGSSLLVSFTCRSAATTGKQGTDDTRPADWQAVVQPE
ncbi:hypothetical protein [Deinococcus sp. PESE-13]